MSFLETLFPYIPELLGVLCFIIGYIILTKLSTDPSTDTLTDNPEQIHSSSSSIDQSIHNFDEYLSSPGPKDLKAFNTMLKSCQNLKLYEKFSQIFNYMKDSKNPAPNSESYEIFARVLFDQRRYTEVINLCETIQDFYYNENLQICNFECLFKNLQVDRALAVFEESQVKDKVFFSLMNLLIRSNYQDYGVWLYTNYKLTEFDDWDGIVELACRFECTGLVMKIVLDENKLNKNTMAVCVRTLVKCGQVQQSHQVLEKMIKSRQFDETSFCFYLDYCGKQGKFELISEVFHEFMSESFIFTVNGCNALMDCCIKCQKFSEIWPIVSKMHKFEIIPDTFTYSCLIKTIKTEGESSDLDLVFDYFDYLKLHKGIQIDEILFNCLLDACVSAKRLDKALILFNDMPKHDEISYNTLIKGFTITKQVDKALDFLQRMKNNGITPTAVTYNSIIDTCVRCSKIALAWEYLEEMQQKGLNPDNFTYSTLVKGIKGENSSHELDRILKIVEKGQTTPDEVLFNCLIDACCRVGDTGKCIEIFKQMQNSNIEASSVTYGIMIKAYGQANMLNKALDTFNEMSNKGLKANDVTYGCLLDACVKSGEILMAQNLFVSMQRDGIVLNTILYTTMIKGYSKTQNLSKALELFQEMKKTVQANNVTYNSLLDCAVRCEDLRTANLLFDEMQEIMQPDLITYSTMIKGLCKAGEVKSALKILNTMQQNRIQPDEVLFNSLLDGCAKLGNLEIAETVYTDMKSLGIRASNVTYSILVKLYGKNKQISRALEVLDDMKSNKIRPGLIVYTCLLQACIRCKQIQKALDIYTDMTNNGVRGDRVTFNTLVNGCVYARQLEPAYKIAIDSFSLNVILADDVYNNLLKNLSNSRIANRNELIQEISNKMKKCGVEVDKNFIAMPKVNCENTGVTFGNKAYVKKVAMNERSFNIRS